MRSPIRALLVALVTTLAVVLVFPSIAQAKSRQVHSSKTTTTHTKTTTKRVVKHPWKKGHHAKAHASPHRARKSSGAKHPWKKKG